MENNPTVSQPTSLQPPKQILLSENEARARATQIHAEMQIKYEALKYSVAMLVAAIQGKGSDEATKALTVLPTLRTAFEAELRGLLESGK